MNAGTKLDFQQKKSSVMMVLVGWCEESGGLTMMYLGHGNKSPDLTIQFPLTAN